MTTVQTPNWASEWVDVDDFITTATREAVNIPQSGTAGRGVHIGVFDSARTLSDWQYREHLGPIHSGPGHSYIEDDDEFPTHGRDVFRHILKYSPYAEVSLYQVTNSDRDIETAALDRAITNAIEDGVDIVNISGGDSWRGPVEFWPSGRHIERLLEEHITVVAAAGNYKPAHDERPPVHCPAALEDVIAVGGHETYCPAEPGAEGDEPDAGPYYILRDDSDSERDGTNEVYCGGQGCVDGNSCIANQTEELWQWNPTRTDDKPDTFAPMHTVRRDDDDILYLESGTSFAAPVVTASLANIYSEIRSNDGDLPYPWEACEAVRNASLNTNQRQIDKYDAMAVREVFGLVG